MSIKAGEVHKFRFRKIRDTIFRYWQFVGINMPLADFGTIRTPRTTRIAQVCIAVLLACLAPSFFSQPANATNDDPVLIIVGPGINDAIGVNDALNGPNTKAGQLLYHTLQTFGVGAKGFKPTSVRFEGDLAYFRITIPKTDADNPGRIVGYERKEIGYPADAENREMMTNAGHTVASQVAGESRRAILTIDMDLDGIPVAKGVASIAAAAAEAIGNMIPGRDTAYRLSLTATGMPYTPPADWQERVDAARTIWNTETERTAVFIEQAAREFKRKFGPNAKVVVVGHSAFTNAINLAPLRDENDMRLIDMRVMSSPMMHVMNEPDPDHTLFVTHDTDFPSANMGNPLNPRSEGDLQREGTVITLHGTSSTSWWEDPAVAAGRFVRERTPAPFGAGERLAEELVTNIQSHAATQQYSRTFDMDVCAHGRCVQHRGTLAQVINRQADAIFTGKPVAQTLTQTLHQEAPKETPVGGISLTKPAEMPFSAAAVRNLTVTDEDPPRLAFTMRDDVLVLLPVAEPGISAAAFACVYGENRGPELSLDIADFDGRVVQSVRYPCASAARTALANAMLSADEVLGSIAWGQTADYSTPPITNYHPYAEIALDDPRINNGALTGRAWLVPALVRLEWGEDNALRLSEARMAVRFEFWEPQHSKAYLNGAKIGMRTPAGEFLSTQLTQAYADTLEQTYPVLRDLREPVSLTASLLWARLNRIPADARADSKMKRLLDEAHTRYAPPSPVQEVVRGESLFHIFPLELRKVDDSSLVRPAAIFNEYGLSRLLWEDGSESRIEYADGRIERLVGRDGRAARLLYNGDGVPLGIIGEDDKGIAAIPERGFSIIAIGAKIDPATMAVMVPRHAPMFVEGNVGELFAELVSRWLVAQRLNDSDNSWLILGAPERKTAFTVPLMSWIVALAIIISTVILFRRKLFRPVDNLEQIKRWLALRRLRSKDFDTRTKAFFDATKRRDIKSLLVVIEDADEYMRNDAIKALGQIGDSMAVPALIQRLDDANFNNQENAAAALAKIGDGRAIHPLMVMLRAVDKNSQARNAAAQALVQLGDCKAVPSLLDALQDHDAFSRALSLQALAVIGDAHCVPAVIAALRDFDSNVQWSAVKTLGALRDARAVEPLIDLLARKNASLSWMAKDVIIEALGQIGDIHAARALIPLLGDEREDARRAVATALVAIGWQPTDDAERARYYVAQQRWDELARLGWERARESLLESLQGGDNNVRRHAVTALGKIGGGRAVEQLILALKDTDEGVQREAAMVLGEIGDVRAVTPLVDYCLRYSPEGGYRNDPGAAGYEQGRAAQWVNSLETLVKRLAADIAPEDLRQLASLNDKTYHLRVDYDTPGYGDGADDFVVMLDFSRVRQLATKVLRHRGLDR